MEEENSPVDDIPKQVKFDLRPSTNLFTSMEIEKDQGKKRL